MKKLLLIIILSLGFINTTIANQSNCVDYQYVQDRNGVAYLPNQEKPFTGIMTCINPDDKQKVYQVTYKDGIENGIAISWYENGQKKSKVNYINKNKNGEATKWFENGQRKSIQDYKDDTKHGKKITWYENGVKKSEGNYLNGKKVGHWIWWYENTQKEEEVGYIDGNKDGQFISWYENGIKKQEGLYKNGAYEGKWVIWFDNGDKQGEENFLNGMRHGALIKYYWRSDFKEGEFNYLNDKEHGKWTTWHENGQMKQEGFYNQGEKEGIWRRWYSNGNDASKQLHDLDKEIIVNVEISSIPDVVKLEPKTLEVVVGESHSTNLVFKNTSGETNHFFLQDKIPASLMPSEITFKKIDCSFCGGNSVGVGNAKPIKIKPYEELVKNITFILEPSWIHKAQANWKPNDIKVNLNIGNCASRLIDCVPSNDANEKNVSILKSAWINNIAARVKSFWRYQSAEDDWTAEVYVIQDRNGNVKAVDVKNANVGNSALGKSFMDSIERAVNKASPLPRAPDDAVFDSEIYMLFSVK